MKIGFDSKKYLKLQRDKIREKIKLILEKRYYHDTTQSKSYFNFKLRSKVTLISNYEYLPLYPLDTLP